jgi:hypothetical protein
MNHFDKYPYPWLCILLGIVAELPPPCSGLPKGGEISSGEEK